MLGDARASRDPFRCFDLSCVALAVAESERVHGKTLMLRDCEHGGRIESAAEENDGGRSSGGGGRFQRRASAKKSKAGLASERLRQRFDQLLGHEWLRQHRFCAERADPLLALTIDASAQDDDGNVRCVRRHLDLFQGVFSGSAGHVDVEHDRIDRRRPFRLHQSLDRIEGGEDLVSLFAKETRHQMRDYPIVINDENCRYYAAPAKATRRGRKIAIAILSSSSARCTPSSNPE